MNRPRRFRFGLVGIVALGVVLVIGAIVIGLEASHSESHAPAASVSSARLALTELPLTAPGPTMSAVAVVERVGPAVVTVVNQQRLQGVGTNQLFEVGSGTGFIIDRDGHIVTNNHVVVGGQGFEVILADGTKRPAKLLGGDAAHDLAVLQISGPIPATVVLGDSDKVLPGQPVLAIGSPLGTFTNTVTSGIVSGLNRTVDEGKCQPRLTGLIQHDAPVNPGNSGGPLLNLSGQVVGVNTIGIPQQNGQPIFGIFLAIPSNTVRSVVSQLIAQSATVAQPLADRQLITAVQ